MTKKQFQKLCELVKDEIYKRAPKDTGNLSSNALRIEYVTPDECKIYIDQSIAPYMPYTNEKWISERWKGKKNPNEGWWQGAIATAIETITAEFKVEDVVKK